MENYAADYYSSLSCLDDELAVLGELAIVRNDLDPLALGLRKQHAVYGIIVKRLHV